jgi:hypothetical protein
MAVAKTGRCSGARAAKNGRTSSGTRMLAIRSGTRRVPVSSAGFEPGHFWAFLALLKARTRKARRWFTVAGTASRPFALRRFSTSPEPTCSNFFETTLPAGSGLAVHA